MCYVEFHRQVHVAIFSTFQFEHLFLLFLLLFPLEFYLELHYYLVPERMKDAEIEHFSPNWFIDLKLNLITDVIFLIFFLSLLPFHVADSVVSIEFILYRICSNFFLTFAS